MYTDTHKIMSISAILTEGDKKTHYLETKIYSRFINCWTASLISMIN